MQWDLSTIPASAVVTSASISLYVSTSSSQTYNLYNMRRSWVEGTGEGEVSGDGATWLTYNGTNTWGTSGAANTENDRHDINLWNAGTTSFSSTGSKTVNLNSNGIETLQGWINGSVANHGLTMQNYSTTSYNDDLQFASSENTTNAGPTLNITYSMATGTTYTLTVTTDSHGSISFSPAGGLYTENSTVTLTPVPNTGYVFSAWDGVDDNDLIDNGNGTWSIIMNDNKSLSAIFTETLVNDPPDQPALIQPADNGTDIGTSPVLQVAVSDPDASDVMDISFYGRQEGTTTVSPDFTMVIIPDPQNLATSYPSIYTGQTQWIVDNKTSANVAFVTCVGDVVNTSSSATEYQRADAAFDILDAGGIPYSVSPGNHDMSGASLWPTYFGPSRISSRSWYGGSYDNYNTYSLFSASGNDFILINLQYSPGTAVLNWADNLLKDNTSRRGIIVQHDILNVDNSWNNQASFTALKDNPNLAMMFCGHMHNGSDGAAYRAEPGDDGHTIHVIQADYQDFGDDGYLRILRFSPSEDMIYMTTYSPSMDSYLTSSTNYDQANLVYDLANGTSAPFALIGTAEDVANGANASTTWSGLSADTRYEWYASSSDGTLSTNGPVWSFTTGATVVNYTLTTNEVGNGSVNLEPSSSSYPSGTIVTLTPVPDPGWSFTGWSGDLTGSANPAVVTMDANKSITATFTQNNYTLTVNTTGSGSVAKSPDQPTYTYGDVVTLTATPTAGYAFAGWSGGLSGSDNPTTIIITGNATVAASFTPIVYNLTVSIIGEGTTSPAVGVHSYAQGTIVDLTANPATGYRFVNWTGDVVDVNSATTTVTMDAIKSVTANFTAQEYTLTMNTIGNGSVAKSPDQATYHYGDVVTLNAVPANGNTFDSWSGDLSGTANPATITTTGNTTINATFTEYIPVSLGVEGSATSGTAPNNSTAISITHTTGTSTDRLMLVGVSWNCSSTSRNITSVTFTPSGGSATDLTAVLTQQAGTQLRYSAIYSLLNPPSGVNGVIMINFSGTVSNGIIAGVVNFAGVNQTTPFGTAVGAGSTSQGTAIALTLSGLNGNEIIFDNVFAGASSSSQTLTAGSNQSQLWNNYVGSTRAASSTKQASSGSNSLTWTAGSNTYWAIAAVPINPAFIIPNYDLTMTVNGSGTIAPAPGTHTYPQGTVVDISAVPATGYRFVNWTGEVANTSLASTTVTMDATKTVTANFALEEYSLTVNTSGSGSVNVSPAQPSYHNGDVVSLTAIPAAGYTLDGWSGSLGGNPNPATITISGNMVITANFSEYIPVPLGPDGAVSTIEADDVSTIQIPLTTGTLSDRLMLVGVSWNCGTTDRTISSVTFTPANGIATSLTSVINQQAGSQLRYSAIYNLLNTPRNTSGIVTITFSGVVTNGIVAGAANFAGVNQSTPLGIAGGAGSTNQGTEPTVTLTGLNGNELVFDNVFQGATDETQTLAAGNDQTQLWNAFAGSVRAASSTEQASSASATMSWTAGTSAYWAIAAVPINPAITVTDYNLTMAVSGNGTITPAVGTYSYAQGTVVDISAIPATGYQFVNWTGEVANVNSAITTVTMDASKTVTANFVPVNSLMVTSPNGGEIWQVGSSHNITWTSTGTIGDVNLAYSIDGSVWTDIIASTGNTGTYSWTIPAGLAAGSTYMIRVSETDGEPSDISNAAFTLFIASVNQEIILLQGWNIFSLYVIPENDNMLTLVQPLIDNGSLVKVQSQVGSAIETNIDGIWFNDIGLWNISEGYKIKVNAGTTLNVTGTPITEPVTIGLESGWNIISYPVPVSYDAMAVLNSLITTGHLTKVQNESGDAIELDLDDEWFNDIGTLDPDEGYKVRLTANESLSIDPDAYGSGNSLKSTKVQSVPSTLKSAASVHFRPIWTGNGLDQMNIYITLASDGLSSFKTGDELGIFDGPNCVGSGIIRNTGTAMQSFIVSADDPSTEEIDGFIAGNRISLKIWQSVTNTETEIQAPEFRNERSKVFEPMGTSMIRINTDASAFGPNVGKTTGLGELYPNPFNEIATIPFTMAEESYVDIAIYNVLGERVKTLVHGTLSAGEHTTVWDATKAGSEKAMPGLYFCKMIVKNEVFVKRIELIHHQ
jgi:uncharacterized repeat protein (TIGR02543 family)